MNQLSSACRGLALAWSFVPYRFFTWEVIMWLLWRTLHGRSRLSGDPLLIGYGVWMARDTKLSDLPRGGPQWHNFSTLFSFCQFTGWLFEMICFDATSHTCTSHMWLVFWHNKLWLYGISKQNLCQRHPSLSLKEGRAKSDYMHRSNTCLRATFESCQLFGETLKGLPIGIPWNILENRLFKVFYWDENTKEDPT